MKHGGEFMDLANLADSKELFIKIGEEYALSADWDNRWRTGGTLQEVVEEYHLSLGLVFEGIECFAKNQENRLRRLKAILIGADFEVACPRPGPSGDGLHRRLRPVVRFL